MLGLETCTMKNKQRHVKGKNSKKLASFSMMISIIVNLHLMSKEVLTVIKNITIEFATKEAGLSCPLIAMKLLS